MLALSWMGYRLQLVDELAAAPVRYWLIGLFFALVLVLALSGVIPLR